MLYFILTTGRCNLKCLYCGGSFPEELVPWSVKYDLRELKKFIERDSSPSITFYGGEPLLNSKFMEKVMEEVPADRFVVQTNGLLVDKLPERFWRRMDTVLLSVDGPREITDYYRGRGVYDAVMRAAEKLRSSGFSGDLIARMAVSELSDIERDVRHLLSLGIFDHVHWQLDVIWSDRWRDFHGWADESYKPGLRKLVDFWIREMRKGRVLGIVPFQGVMRAVLLGGMKVPPCGAGVDAFAISTDGRILACPIAFESDWAFLGRLGEVSPDDLPNRVRIGGRCSSCPYLNLCGGRCLFANKESYWSDEDVEKVCEITRYMLDLILSRKDEILKLVRQGVIDEKDLLYPAYNNTTEIIP